jgi:hypothetical protein
MHFRVCFTLRLKSNYILLCLRQIQLRSLILFVTSHKNHRQSVLNANYNRRPFGTLFFLITQF